jgi:hypothetical protein
MSVEIEAVQLGGAGIEPLDAYRPDDQAPVADDEEFPARELVVTAEIQEVADLREGLEDESVLGEHAPDEDNDAGSVDRHSGLYGQTAVGPLDDGREPGRRERPVRSRR